MNVQHTNSVDSSPSTASTRLVPVFLLPCGLVVFWVLRQALSTPPQKVQPTVAVVASTPVRPDIAVVGAQIREKIANRTQKAQDQSKAAANDAVARVREYLTGRRAGAMLFADEVLSLHGKYVLLTSYLPWKDSHEYQNYLRQEFKRTVLNPDELATVLRQAVAAALAGNRDAEDQLLVDLRIDMDQIATTAQLPALPDSSVLRTQLDSLIHEKLAAITGRVGTDIGRNVGMLMADVILTKVMQSVLMKLGLSSTTLGTGAALSPETLGLSLVAGFAIDWVVSWYWNPQGEVADRVAEAVNHLSTIICDGEADQSGLGPQLINHIHQRSLATRAALESLLLNSLTGPSASH